ncbi:hypothetical protein [Nocardia sp. NPDC057455]|uniref:hypothetical protein n=1 Tax=Nocardia sp. NPDC057455 TaxID=3346138 RepID=UPI00367085EE
MFDPDDQLRQALSAHIAADQLAALDIIAGMLGKHGAALREPLDALRRDIAARAEQDKAIGQAFNDMRPREHRLPPELAGALIRIAIQASGFDITAIGEGADEREHD